MGEMHFSTPQILGLVMKFALLNGTWVDVTVYESKSRS